MAAVSADLADLTGTGLEFSVDGGVATVTLARPERRNAMTPGMWRGLARSALRYLIRSGWSSCAGLGLRSAPA